MNTILRPDVSCVAPSITTPPDPAPGMVCCNTRCGDGFLDLFEQCDNGNPPLPSAMNSDTAANSCRTDCSNFRCGDGVTDAGEQCDGSSTCNATCVSSLFTCGNNIVDSGESCDDGNTNNHDACLNTCVPAQCGDFIVQTGVEQCDDGNLSNTDACVQNCRDAKCGDNFLQTGVEECDDNNTANNDGCSSTCKGERCGDGITHPNGADGASGTPDDEQCDDANMVATDACYSCKNAKCGDAQIQAGVEDCDDGNILPNDGCSSTCKSETSCGDGTTQPAGTDGVPGNSDDEQCDDGNTVNNDACSSNCKIEKCGDKTVQPAGADTNIGTADDEQCDDANPDNTDVCTNACKWNICGDGFPRPVPPPAKAASPAQECDDGDLINNDECSNACKNPICGDGVCNGAENSVSCFSDCALALCPAGSAVWPTLLCLPPPIHVCLTPYTFPFCCCSNSVVFFSTVSTALDTTRDGVLSTPEMSRGIIKTIRNISTQNAESDFNSDETVDREDLRLLVKVIREFLAAVCGNSKVEAGEQCDDGNSVSGDGCGESCKAE